MSEPEYCPRCRTPWVSGNDFCVGGCGWTVDWLEWSSDEETS